MRENPCNCKASRSARRLRQSFYLPINLMLHWTLVFLVIALIAAVLGFGSLAGTAAAVAKVLFLIFLVVWVISFFTRR